MKNAVLVLIILTSFIGLAQERDFYPAKVYFRDGSDFEGYVSLVGGGKTLFKLEKNDEAEKFDGYIVSRIDFTEYPYNSFEYHLVGDFMKLLYVDSRGDLTLLVRLSENYSDQMVLKPSQQDEETYILGGPTPDVRFDNMSRANVYSNGGGITRKITYYALKYDSSEPISLKPNFRKKAMEYFSDCPGLVEKIRTRELKYEDFKDIADYYNNFCYKEELEED